MKTRLRPGFGSREEKEAYLLQKLVDAGIVVHLHGNTTAGVPILSSTKETQVKAETQKRSETRSIKEERNVQLNPVFEK